MTMRRRPLIAGGLALVATPRIVLPQAKDKIWRVGVLVLTSRAIALDPQFFIGGFPQGMRERGYAESKIC